MAVPRVPSAGREADVRRAWWSLGLFVPPFAAAFVTGEALLVALGHSGDHSPPAGTALAAGLPALMVFALPTLLVRHFRRRAGRHGDPESRTPVTVALVVAGAVAALNLSQLVARFGRVSS